MALLTSSQFASAMAAGKDWRDAARNVLGLLENAEKPKGGFNFGFLYVTDHLGSDLGSILDLFKSVTGIENWIGTIGLGVCGSGKALIDQPAVSAMIGHFSENDFCIFPALQEDEKAVEDCLRPWLEKQNPMLVFTHGDPMSDEDPAETLKRIEEISGGFLVGGLSSSRSEHFLISGDICQNGVCGAAFADTVKVATAHSLGCKPIGEPHTITQGDDHVIRQLDSKNVVDVFENDLRMMAMEKIGKDPDMIMVDEDSLEDREAMPDEYKNLFKGEVCIGFPVPGSDQTDFLVRDIIGINEDGSMIVSQPVINGERITFVLRDEETMNSDLSKSLVDLRSRVQRDNGAFAPKGAVYISCVARSLSDGDNQENNEMNLIRDIIGDVPLTGFYAGGEICNGRLYGYSGILILFL